VSLEGADSGLEKFALAARALCGREQSREMG
jgi:hypothetical protein